MLYHGKRLILASDKPIPGEQRSALFTLPLISQGPDDSKLEYFTTSLIKQAVKQPTLVTSPKDDALEFEHKAEGLGRSTIRRLVVAYDNDRHLGLGSVDEHDERHACEAPYTLLRVS